MVLTKGKIAKMVCRQNNVVEVVYMKFLQVKWYIDETHKRKVS